MKQLLLLSGLSSLLTSVVLRVISPFLVRKNLHSQALSLFAFLVCSTAYAQSEYLKAYPDHIVRFTKNQLIWKDSTAMPFDDGQKKTFAQLLQNADLEDQLAQKYPLNRVQNPPTINQDPGRFRYEPFFRKMYGHTEAEVRKNLTEIIWLPKTLKKKLLVTKVNEIDKHFQAVSDELEKHPELLKYVNNPAGTFSWRVISGTNRLSMHSYGTAIDINLNLSHYWQWDCRCKDEAIQLKYRNLIAAQVVEIFEKHGFIWGGKWYHYDTMHFEYRPELLLK
ncbi:M15 family metallopeptidase [Runella salmonicolor]|uniref:M15 family metallopeptidase n=1 Tax=Runella salmonicolor TaxID=2950278 RepID=A0ABT1FPK4_9BACT|nr:M15 family metallopeptidase [Runella salmonicolor]MCP1383701.1 M15 family metallopeptidase [Runella salmonicolor]